ncbi:MAG: ribonuclease H-like domain-containing protein [Myxococcales bacterium]|nr:ribonuclease H-like domain-containing protein [Myxococcales bacterium]
MLPGAGSSAVALDEVAGPAVDATVARRVVFLDTETTGLGRDAGSLAFLVGLAWYDADEGGEVLCVEQWTLTRMSGEGAMLASVLDRLESLGGAALRLVSFNGRTFDVPLLEQRVRRARLARSLAALASPHVDLLYPARRLWRDRGPDCRLVTLERTQLGVRRVGDIPGAAIPAVFWRSIERPSCVETQHAMRRVREHNAADLVAMPALLQHIAGIVREPGDVETAIRVARLLEGRGARERAFATLAPWLGLDAGTLDPVRDRTPAPVTVNSRAPKFLPSPTSSRTLRAARRVAAELLRQLGRHAEAARQWEQLCAEEPGDPRAHEALAKDLEHRRRDHRRALEVAASSSAPCPRRIARLERKVSGSGALRPAGTADAGGARDMVFLGPREPTTHASIAPAPRGAGRAVPGPDGQPELDRLHDAVAAARADECPPAREGPGSAGTRAALHRQLDLRLA